MNGEKPNPAGAFTSRMTRGETAAAVCYLAVHLWLLPKLLFALPQTASLSDADINLICYAVGFLYMLVFAGRFLRRDFDPVCDDPFYTFLQIVICYGMMIAFNLILNTLLTLLPVENPNSAAVIEMAGQEFGKTAAMAVFLAPLLEELIFRAGIFGFLRPYSRTLAYLTSMLLFALYHVWGYALSDPIYWLYLLQYLPVSWLLCRCYERCNSIWGSIFLHMTINGISLYSLSFVSEYL
ncbi:MAG: CPBP family intramembrane metalloprotease [Oscillospiraceae bacterium]|nr:CPBP family intramembrane metalloprotease [Oscillospiraceae bacterium]